jgi:hypothetical protein
MTIEQASRLIKTEVPKTVPYASRVLGGSLTAWAHRAQQSK